MVCRSRHAIALQLYIAHDINASVRTSSREILLKLISTCRREGFVVDPFWGTSTPESIAALPRTIEAGGQDGLRAALTVAVGHLCGGETGDEDIDGVDGTLLRGTIAVLSAAVKARANDEVIARDLGNIGVTGAGVADIVRVCDPAIVCCFQWESCPRFRHVTEHSISQPHIVCFLRALAVAFTPCLGASKPLFALF